ncbi:unnamed protein product [Linum tenue]|nr:unnamed protein product [Linum tenue]
MQMGSATEVQTMNSPGLIIKNTDSIRWFLRSASNETHLPLELKDAASRLLSQDNVHYVSLRSIWTGSQPSSRPELMLLLSGSEFIFPTPKPREKGEELKARLRKLEELAERKAYQELVKDITPSKETTEPFSSYKDQLGFGLHVGLTMFTGYLVGYAAFRALFGHSPAMSAAGGILGLVGAMLLETLLFIIRTSDPAPKSNRTKLKKP